MKKIVVKEIDKLTSSVYENKKVSEYLIYLILDMDGEEIKLNGFLEIGEANKNSRVEELLLEHFHTSDYTENIDYRQYVNEITFEEIYN